MGMDLAGFRPVQLDSTQLHNGYESEPDDTAPLVGSSQTNSTPAYPHSPSALRPSSPGTEAGASAVTCNAPRLVMLLVLLGSVIGCSTLLDGARMQALLKWVAAKPVEGGILFLAMYVIALVVMFPSVVLSLAAGALFGLFMGSFLAWLGTCLGQTVAFVAGRYLLRQFVHDFTVRRFPTWQHIDAAVSKEGWKLITLLRLSPIIPWNVLNYALAITGVGLWDYTIASSISIIPWCVMFVYFGSLASTLADVFDGKAGPDPGYTVVFGVVSGIMVVAVVVYTTIISRRAVKEAIMKSSGSDAAQLRTTIEDFDRGFAMLPSSPMGAAGFMALRSDMDELHEIELELSAIGAGGLPGLSSGHIADQKVSGRRFSSAGQ